VLLFVHLLFTWRISIGLFSIGVVSLFLLLIVLQALFDADCAQNLPAKTFDGKQTG
jgi:hypothetical protein